MFCWLNSIAQCISAVVSAQPDVELNQESHVGQFVTKLRSHDPVPLSLRGSAIASLDSNGVDVGRTIRRGLVLNILSAAGLLKHGFSADRLWFGPVVVRSSPSAQRVLAGVEVQPAGNGSYDTHAVAIVFVAGAWWRCDDDKIVFLAKPPVEQLHECAVLFCVE